MQTALSTAIVTTIGLTCKAFLNSPFCSVDVNGLHTLIAAMEAGGRQGIVTVSNHISTLDDPVVWGVLPAKYYLSPRTTRWALGASDIVFTNPLFSAFFSLGQTLQTFRGHGIYQPALDTAVQKLDQGGWVHLYGEGKVNQSHTYSRDENGLHLQRFKWGVGRIIMETSVPPLVIPMWLSGFDTLMPEGRPFPNKYIPRLGARLGVTFGDPIPADNIRKALGKLGSHTNLNNMQPTGWVNDKEHPALNPDDKAIVRAEITAIIQRAVESLGTLASDTPKAS